MKNKSYRTITVDGQNYRWLTKSRGMGDRGEARPGFLVAIDHAAAEGQILAARFDLGSLAGLESRVLSPKDIARLIRAGLEKGWTPLEPGAPFVIRGEEVVR